MNDEKEKPKNPKKNSKKKLFQGVIREEIESSQMGDFISNMDSDISTKKSNVEDKNKVKENLPIETSNGDEDSKKVKEKNIEMTGDNPQIEDKSEKKESKKELSNRKPKIHLSEMEEKELEKINPNNLTQSDIKYEDGSGSFKGIMGVLIVIAALIVAYIYFPSFEPAKPKILLSNSEIKNFSASSKKPYKFKLGQPIFIGFDNMGSLNTSTVKFRINQIYKGTKGKEVSKNLRLITYSIDPEKETIRTYIHKNYLRKTGKFELQILNAGNEILAVIRFILQ